MDTAFLICAIVGITLSLCQIVFGMMGFGGGHDGDIGGELGGETSAGHATHAGHGSGAGFWSWVSMRAVFAGVAVFGLAGKVALGADLPLGAATGIAVAAALLTLLAVGALMRGVTQLVSDGTAHIENARGATGSVYVTIPGDHKGSGRAQIELQGRTVEFNAITYANTLETGTQVVVVDIVSPDTVEVIAVSQMRGAHA